MNLNYRTASFRMLLILSLTLILVAIVSALGNTADRSKIDRKFNNAFFSEEANASIKSSATAVKPNVIEILLDDLDERTLLIMMEHDLLPNIKALADEGTRFTQSFVSTSLCCPSRTTGLTGQYTHNHEVYTLYAPHGGVTKYRDDANALPVKLRKAGYRTGFTGKYLNGYGNDQNKKTLSPRDDPRYVPPGWSDWQGLTSNSTYQMYEFTINDNGTLVRYGNAEKDYQTDVLARRSVSFINESEAQDEQPFFLMVTPLAPHYELAQGGLIPGCQGSEWERSLRSAPRHSGTLPPDIILPEPPSLNEPDVSDKGSKIQNMPLLNEQDQSCLEQGYRNRAESLLAVDDMISSLRSTLQANGELERTVMILTSDNGWFNGEHRLTAKTLFYEESIRVPLIVSSQHINPGLVDKFALSNDLVPTILDLANATTDVLMDGRSLVPLLVDPGAVDSWRKRVLIEYYVTKPSLKQVVAVRTSSEDVIPSATYLTWVTGEKEFYDLVSDPYQLESSYSSLDATTKNLLNNVAKQLAECVGKRCIAAEN